MTNKNYKNRSNRIRRKLKKINTERFRLTVFRSAKNISAQIIDSKNNKTLISATSVSKKEKSKNKANKSLDVAQILIKKALEKKIFVGAKLYPNNVTTNSKMGINNIESIFPSLEILEEFHKCLAIMKRKF